MSASGPFGPLEWKEDYLNIIAHEVLNWSNTLDACFIFIMKKCNKIKRRIL